MKESPYELLINGTLTRKWEDVFAEYNKTKIWGELTLGEYRERVIKNYQVQQARYEPLDPAIAAAWSAGRRKAKQWASQREGGACDMNGRLLEDVRNDKRARAVNSMADDIADLQADNANNVQRIEKNESDIGRIAQVVRKMRKAKK